jgi:hypothetical protein
MNEFGRLSWKLQVTDFAFSSVFISMISDFVILQNLWRGETSVADVTFPRFG